MINRTQIEQILRINGVPVSAPDEEIKSVLLSARWHEDDIETAIMVLRENTKSHKTHVDTVHKVFHTDDKLDPKTVSSLLGIEMNITPEQVQSRSRNAKGGLRFNSILVLTLVSLILSVLFVFAAMWYLKMGLFYQLR
tara:strand:+ start:24 stop:437 length:414 start_codon:yes stop_codon:yes gene_type:complete